MHLSYICAHSAIDTDGTGRVDKSTAISALQQKGESYDRVRETLKHSRDFRDLRRFLVCVLFYQAGITAVVSLAAIYAEQAMKFTMQQTIVLILVVNVTAALGAFGFGYLQDAIGHVRAVALTAGHERRRAPVRDNVAILPGTFPGVATATTWYGADGRVIRRIAPPGRRVGRRATAMVGDGQAIA